MFSQANNYFINESIILKNESFCVVCIITYVTVVLLCKDGSNTLHVILHVFCCLLCLDVAAFQLLYLQDG